ncbi:MAG: SDR family oxidoreductase [Myxococcales bacterium]|jgi:uncharacterized protein YbjT (DUF2867 family)|nr:SDR family oxidoreductase [Myxococcales bacterium]
MILVVGSTGLLGREIVRLLRAADVPVRALVRASSDSSVQATLREQGAETVVGDLKSPDSLAAACDGVRAVISTASATLSRQPGDSIESVDEQGHLALVNAARNARVDHFVHVSFAPLHVDCALQRAKRTVERAVEESEMAHTILQPLDFMEVWLSPALGFDPVHGKARILGDGQQPVNWVSFLDVARFAVAALEVPALRDKTLPLGGPDALSQLDVVRLFEQLGGPKVELEFVPEGALEAQLAGAQNPIEEAFAALMLNTARGYRASPRAALELVPGRMMTVREFATRQLKNAQQQ